MLSPFEQVADHLTKENEGTGLGLPIARALIELHGGNLTLSSDLGIGTTVVLRLPSERIHGVAPARHDAAFPTSTMISGSASPPSHPTEETKL